MDRYGESKGIKVLFAYLLFLTKWNFLHKFKTIMTEFTFAFMPHSVSIILLAISGEDLNHITIQPLL